MSRRTELEALVVGVAGRICAECKPPEIRCSLLGFSGNLIMSVGVLLGSHVFLSLRVGLVFRMKMRASKWGQVPS